MTFAADPELRRVTVVFIDMVGFSRLSESLDEEITLEVIKAAADTIRIAAGKRQGRLLKVMGDGFLVVFGVPEAIEDAAYHACQFVLDAWAALPLRLAEVMGAPARDLKFRAGINSGTVISATLVDSDPTQMDLLGDTVNISARLQQTAQPGEITLSDATRTLVEGRVVLRHKGNVLLRGRTQLTAAFALEGLSPDTTRFERSRRRGLSPLVGRAAELDRLRAWWTTAKTGQATLGRLSGEAGIGKTRLLHEFVEWVIADRGDALTCECTPEASGIALHPIRSLLRKALLFGDDDNPLRARRKLSTGLELLGISEEASQAAIEYLLEIHHAEDALENASRTASALRKAILDIVDARCRIGPLLIVVDDAQWIDNATMDLIEDLGRIGDSRLLVVVASRPALARLGADSTADREIRLGPLADRDVEAILAARTGAANPPPLGRSSTVAMAGGNPLFIEEIADRLAGSVSGNYWAADPLGIPERLEDIIRSRLDTVPPEHRRTLEAAGMIGVQFRIDILPGLLEVETTRVQSTLDLLAGFQILTAGGEPGTWRFHHPLFREASIAAIPKSRRRRWHARLAELLSEQGAPDAVIAHHFYEAREALRAAPYYARAARRHLHLYALDEAEQAAERALSAWFETPEPPGEAPAEIATLALAQAMYLKGDFRHAAERLSLLARSGEQVGWTRVRVAAGLNLAFILVLSGQSEGALAALREVHAADTGEPDALLRGYSELVQATHAAFWEQPSTAQSAGICGHCANAIGIADETGDTWLKAMALYVLARDALMHGRPNDLRRHAATLFEIAQATGDPLPRQLALLRLSSLDANSRAPRDAIEKAEAAHRLAIAPLDRLTAEAHRGVALAAAGRGPEALATLTAVRTAAFELGNKELLLITELTYGAALVLTDRPSEGVRSLERSIQAFRRDGYHMGVAMGHLVLGEGNLRIISGTIRPSLRVVVRNLGFAVSRVPFAARNGRRHLLKALSMFESFDAPSWQAWALYDLAMIEVRQRRTGLAQPLLERALRLATEVGADTVAAEAGAALRQHCGASLP